ncbi:MAG: SPOR domain-containing protein [Flavobacteriales bacterium]
MAAGPRSPLTQRYFAVAMALLGLAAHVKGQQDSATTAPAVATTSPGRTASATSAPSLRPTLGLGAGMFAFFGDVGAQHAAHSPLLARPAFDLRASVPLNDWLEAGLYALHGRLGVNERSLARSLNFESRVTVGGFQFRYNFHQLLNPDRVVEPFVTLGFESVEFLTKTDLRDGQGRTYNYWSDGSIRDIAENSPFAGQAQVIQRDYVYESDVRELNADGFGKYPERTWAVPVGIGARMNLGGGFDFRIGTTMHFTLTDLVDGVTDESVGQRQGSSGNDRFLYSSFSLGYAIPIAPRAKRSKITPLNSEELDLIVLQDDEDGDGVKDMADECPGTPTGVQVDAKGCPLDSDGDGVPDHEDDEAGTMPGAMVDARGVTISDEAYLKRFLNFLDSGNVNVVASSVESFGPVRKAPTRPGKRVYVVKVGSQVEGISEELIQRILSLPDVRTVESGDTTFYVVGSFDAIPEALRRELELRGMGIESRVMAEENGRLIDVSKELDAERERRRGMGAVDDSRDVIVRVQLGAFRNKLSSNIFRDVPDLVSIRGEDGLMRYYTGSFTDVNEAADHKVKMLLQGFEGAFLVAFKQGRRVSMKEAGAVLTGPEDLRTLPSGSVNKDRLRFRVQVGSFVGSVSQVPMETMGKYIEIGDVEPVIRPDGVRYFHGRFSTRAEAESARQRLKGMGLEDAFVVGEMNGHVIPAEDAERLLNGQ